MIFPEKKENVVRFLCISDVHLGKNISFNDQLAFEGIDKVWLKIAKDIEKTKADVVLLAGDMIDSETDFFEAAGVLEKGIRDILAKKIPVVAISGNHDFSVFSKLRHVVPSEDFHILGEGSKWQSASLSVRGQKVRIDGFSFSSQHYKHSPFLAWDLQEVPSDQISIGLIHCDCDGDQSSPYAPVKLREFSKFSHQAWVLGHVHIPQVLSSSPHVFYCGSLVGLDRSEDDLRGFTLLDVSKTKHVEHHFIPYSPLVWKRVVIDSAAFTEDNWQEMVLQSVIKLHESIQAHDEVVSVACQIIFEGRTTLYRNFSEMVKELENKVLMMQPNSQGKEVVYYIDDIRNHSRPCHDLGELSKGKDLVGILARCLIDIENEEEVNQEAWSKWEGFLKGNAYFPTSEVFFSKAEARQSLMLAGYKMLDMFLAQKEIL